MIERTMTGVLARSVGLLALVASSAAAHPRGPDAQAQLGLVAGEFAGYFGSHPDFSDGKFDSNGPVYSAVGAHVGFGFRPIRMLELGPRVDLLYTWFPDKAYVPDALYDLRATLSIACVWSPGGSELITGVDIGMLASAMNTGRSGSDLELAAGGTAGVFVSIRRRRDEDWGWFVDVSAGAARVDGGYSADSVWLARISAGATYRM